MLCCALLCSPHPCAHAALRYGKLPLKACSHTVLLLYQAWLAAVYLCTATSQVQPLPPLLDSLGLFVYGQPEQAAGALSLQLLVTLVVAGLARSRSRQQQELLSTPGGAAGLMGRNCPCLVMGMRRVRQHWHAAHESLVGSADSQGRQPPWLALARTCPHSCGLSTQAST
jgi:hypothetical protein